MALDWALGETMLAIGCPPVGMVQPKEYSRWEGVGQLPATIADVGLMTEPNIEFMASLAPDVILVSARQSVEMGARLARIAPVERFDLYQGDGRPLDALRTTTMRLGSLLKLDGQAQALLGRTDDHLARIRERLSAHQGLPVLCVVLQDERHGWVADQGGIVSNVLEALGLRNAWRGGSSFWGFTMVGLQALADYDPALLLVGRFTLDMPDVVNASPIWQALPAVQAKRTRNLDRFWYFGALPTVMRLADLISENVSSVVGE